MAFTGHHIGFVCALNKDIVNVDIDYFCILHFCVILYLTNFENCNCTR